MEVNIGGSYGCRSGSLRTSPKLIPEEGSPPGFWRRLIRFRHFIDGSLALASLNLACWNLVPAFPQRSPPSLLTTAACGGLRSTPDCRPRRGPPSSLVRLRTAVWTGSTLDTRPRTDVADVKNWTRCGLMSWALVCSDSHGDARKCKPEIKHAAFVALRGSARSIRLPRPC